MSKADIMLDLVTGLRSLATSIEAASASMLMDAETDTPAPSMKEETPAPKIITLEQVRSVLAEKSMAGFTDAIRDLLEKHGASKLSQIDPANYAALFADAESLN